MPSTSHLLYLLLYIFVIHRQTVLLYQNSSVWLDTLDSQSWDQNPADSNANPRFYHSATRKPAQAKEFETLMYHICFVYIYPLNGYRELNSFEEPCFMLVAIITPFTRELNPTGVGEHIYCHPQTDCFIVYIYIYISSSSSCAASMDIPNPLSPFLPTVHRLWQVFRATSRILT